MECFHHNSKYKNYFDVKSKPLEANPIISNFHVYFKGQFKTEMYEKDARTRNREWCHCAISLIAKFWLIAKMFQTDFANSEFLATFPLLLRFYTIFHPKTQILIPQHPDLFPKVVYKFMYIKDTQNYIELEIKTSVQENNHLTHFSWKPSRTTQIHFKLYDYDYPWHQSSTTSHNNNSNNQSWIHQQFINNNIIFHQFWVKTQSIHIYTSWSCNFIINNLIHIKFIYPNITSKHKHEFHQLKS